MDVNQLQRGWYKYLTTLFKEGILDDQYKQLQQLQDESTPNFVLEVVSLFFDDSQKIIYELERALSQPLVDYKVIDAYVHQLKGSSSSVGAYKVKEVCVKFRESCENQNKEGCTIAMQNLKHEFSRVKHNLQYLFELEQQILSAGGSIPTIML
ncbi:Histidine-containing phosphotransfer protein [Thalictrum thalictroides]|uniref:Histidine-containing phosphotransfer protein n=1 Tax=Thalictrum thalictroides TaxID=46969 RepID=A0A7J6VDS4_THATH|nr:Histidine-containing phosphotransfer protein [Thalictrum thalictroides]